MEIVIKQFDEHDESHYRFIRRIKTEVVNDGAFKYSGQPLTTPTQWASAFRSLKTSDREQACVLYLAGDFQPIGYDMWLGGVDSVNIDPRRVFFLGSAILASKLVIIHNHPYLSASCVVPSSPDTMFCMTMSNLGELLGMRLEDFIIIHPEGFTSFLESKHPALIRNPFKSNAV